MIGRTTQGLLHDLFESADLFRKLSAGTKRIVKWGPAVEPRVLAHSAVVVLEQLLLKNLERLPLPVVSKNSIG